MAKKISILIPSYNDASSIKETLNSLTNQTYTNWELIFIDDGSTDNTKELVAKYIKSNSLEDKVKYIYQENADQLNAIINGCKCALGDYVHILHSDDLLPDDNFFQKCIDYMQEHSELDGIFGDLVIIDENSNVTNRWRALRYNKDSKMPANLILNNGCNTYGDVCFRTKSCFLKEVYNNYLVWNMPFWIDMDNNAKTLNLQKVPFPILKYRIYSGNYKNNPIGKFCALNGELRTLTRLMAIYNVKMMRIQKILFNITRMRGIRRFGLAGYYTPICDFKCSKYKDVYRNVVNTIHNTYSNEQELNENIYLTALISFFDNLANNNVRELEWDCSNMEQYKGKDIRVFTKRLLNNELDAKNMEFINEMKKGFKTIKVNAAQVQQMEDICKFYNIYPYVEIISI